MTFTSSTSIVAPYIDIHCHILPGLDDGAKSLDEAMAMARMAVDDGTGTVVATPHHFPGFFLNDAIRVEGAAAAFRQHLAREGIPLTIVTAAEVRLGSHVLGWIRENKLPCLNREGERRYVLLEVPHGELEPGSAYLAELIRLHGYHPVIAHPERNLTIARNVELLAPFIAMGCLCQITAESVTGGFGEGVRRVCEVMLDRGWAHVIASDGHGFYRRPPVLRQAVILAAAMVGPEKAQALVVDHPRALLRGDALATS